ncbi:MAG: tetratricopeptide repeat protein, partial [Pseudobdellovibrionaceae bacterium]
ERSNVLYYQQMEREKAANLKLDTKQKLNPIVSSLQEAIEIYKQILKEFPKFAKKDKILYRLAIAQKSIDEGAAFVATSEKLLKEFPKTKESMQVRLLLGQFFFDQQDFKESANALLPASNCEFPYERNAARYRLGLIKMNEEKFAEALGYFEKIATDEELKEEDNPLEVSIQTRTVNSNIKREALIDSIRAFTEVYKKNPDPIGFYNRVAPTENLFQEIIEKLAYRYIFLKNETQAMGLLRVLSERVADPQKVVNIYQEVLLMIPPMERVEVPYQEMQYVLSKYNDWVTYFDVPQKTREESYKFFETQIREMGTKSHDLAKSELSTARKDLLYERSRNFYNLYLGFFTKGPDAVKIATNLADVYYYQKDYLKSGDYYLRISDGEFGPPGNKEPLLQNAILCFQKPAPNDFYEITRNRGLLVRSIQSYQKLDTKKKNDPKLNFILVKSTYEQGLYNQALPALIDFVARNPKATNEIESAVDIGLDYYNIRSDFKGLVDFSQKMMAINSLPPKLRTRLQSVKAKALLKKIDEEVKSKSNYDAFSQGKIYFETALSMQDESMKSVVLEQALARAKSEKDVNTFLNAARALANSEKKADKRASILLGTADQTLAIGRFYQTMDIWKQILSDSRMPDAIKKKTREKVLRLALMLKDWQKIQQMMAAGGVSDTLRQNGQSQIGQYMESGVQVSDGILSVVNYDSLSAEELLPYFKGQFKVSPSIQTRILSAAQAKCGKQRDALVCRWMVARQLPSKIGSFKHTMETAPTNLQSVEPTALKLNALLQEIHMTEETGDPTLDIFTSLYKARAFQYFAQYLKKVGLANKQVAEILGTKASESMQNAKHEYAQCAKVMAAAALMSPINKFCTSNTESSLKEALSWRRTVPDHPTSGDPKIPGVDTLQKTIFVEPNKSETYLELATKYLETKNYRHAVAMANYGISTFPKGKDDFAAVLGCGLGELGLYGEAAFQLKSASDYKGLKNQCWAALKARME